MNKEDLKKIKKLYLMSFVMISSLLIFPIFPVVGITVSISMFVLLLKNIEQLKGEVK